MSSPDHDQIQVTHTSTADEGLSTWFAGKSHVKAKAWMFLVSHNKDLDEDSRMGTKVRMTADVRFLWRWCTPFRM